MMFPVKAMVSATFVSAMLLPVIAQAQFFIVNEPSVQVPAPAIVTGIASASSIPASAALPDISKPNRMTGEVVQTEWKMVAGQTINQELQLWASQAGWTVVWRLEKDWVIPASTTFTGEFQVAAGEVIKTLSSNGAIIQAHFFTGNKTMLVTGAPE